MSVTPKTSRVFILVKALPRPSNKHSETVCCAGIDAYGQFRRLYPVRFRQLKEGSSFKRWDEVEFGYRRPTTDTRSESCHVFEDTIRLTGSVLKRSERAKVLHPLVVGSANVLADTKRSLGIVQPRSTKFFWRKKSSSQIEAERAAYSAAALQTSMFDAELDAIEPTPYTFQFKFSDDGGIHHCSCADWEPHATFFRQRQATSEAEALQFLSDKFNDEYPKKGMLFALGNMQKRPKIWQLLGVLRVDPLTQGSLF